jgi:hypothetical protein
MYNTVAYLNALITAVLLNHGASLKPFIGNTVNFVLDVDTRSYIGHITSGLHGINSHFTQMRYLRDKIRSVCH